MADETDRGISARPMWMFAARFVGIVSLTLALTIRFHGAFAGLSRFWARLLAACLELTGLGPAVAEQQFVTYKGGLRLEVVLECTALHLMGMWLGVLLGFPASGTHRLRGFLVGLAVIGAANLLRLWMAAWVLARWPERFELVHAYVWQAGMIVVLLVLGGWWMRASPGGEAAGGDQPLAADTGAS